VLSLRDVQLRRGTAVLLDGASLTLFSGEKAGIVGRNGSGKSSLLALLRGELQSDAGEVSVPSHLKISWVSQELPEPAASVIDYLLEGDVELLAIEAGLREAERSGNGLELSTLHAQYESAGGYGARARAAELARGVGFLAPDLGRPLGEFSGGMQMRANLARALMRRSDLLLLDEPTNHLDLDAVLWLEEWLTHYRGTLLMVSHDRELLDGVTSRIVHLAQGRLGMYTGNYSAFEVQLAAERERAAALATRRVQEAERIRAFVARFRATASKARQVQSRLKRLARLADVEEPDVESGFSWQFAAPHKLPRPLASLDRVAAGYGARTVLERVSLTIAPGDRLGVLGRNGAGKSTLMRLLAGELTPAEGELTLSPDLVPGFFAQRELERFAAEGTPIGELARLGGPAARWTPQALRDHLGRFGFSDERVFEPLASFSGGERARLGLAVLVARRPNLLLLDEPSNHLDMSARHALSLALMEFEGAVVVVSHDRAFLAELCDRFVLVADGVVAPFEGDLSDYAAWLATRTQQTRREPEQPAQPQSRREERRREAIERNRLSPVRAELRATEQRLDALNARRAELEQSLAQPELYAPGQAERQRQLALEHRQIRDEIDAAETRWLALCDAIEGGA
jgi:ATP-binding cassette subfamily F protein 3